MDEKRANIDLAFRNGLKDYEILPPADVWDGIDKRLARKTGPAYLLRAAAFLALALTLSALAYRWLGTASREVQFPLTATEEESSRPEPSAIPLFIQAGTREESAVRNPVEGVVAENYTIQAQPVADNILAADQPVGQISSLHGTNLRLPFDEKKPDLINSRKDFGQPAPPSFAVDNAGKLYSDFLASESVSDNSAEKHRRWSISALATPTYYGTINSGSDELSRQMMASEQSAVSYSGGVAVSYTLNKRLSIQSGLFYSSVGQNLEGISSFAGFRPYDRTKGDHNFEVLTTNGIVITSNADVFLAAENNSNSNRIISNYNRDVFDPQKANLEYLSSDMRQSFSYLELPFVLRYKVIDKTIDFNLIGGMSYNVLVNNSVYTVIDGNKYMIGTTDGLNMFSISSSIGMGMEYNFSDKLSLNLEPTFRYYLNTFDNSASSQFHPYSFGIFSGLSFKF